MNVRKTEAAFLDERGEIRDILDGQEVNSLTILTCNKGAVRGNHYHKITTQFTYIISGKLKLFTQDSENAEIKTTVVNAGDLVTSPPLERHAFEALENSTILAGCFGPRAGSQYETDTYRLEVPISGPKK